MAFNKFRLQKERKIKCIDSRMISENNKQASMQQKKKTKRNLNNNYESISYQIRRKS